MKRKAVVLLAMLVQSICVMSQTWLALPMADAYVDIGSVDVFGNQLTVECQYTSTSPASVDLVSKHSAPGDVNYLLRQTHAELTTSSGFISTPSTCPPDQNTCRHAAMVYDGTTLKFYLNGQLNGQVLMNGNMAINGWETLIGNYGCCFAGEQFFGFIDEVRIWNVPRTQTQIQTFMFTQLPTPTLQTGLLACYTFNSLTNLQGNAAFDGFMAGPGISLSNNNPFCVGPTPVCAVLGEQFDRFTFVEELAGLRFDWEWRGENPQKFLLEAGAEVDRMAIVQEIAAGERDYQLRPAPTQPTWYRLAAMDADGAVVRSNAVQYVPKVEEALELLAIGGHALVKPCTPDDGDLEGDGPRREGNAEWRDRRRDIV
ncbi:MAG: LamG domain-containing protein [Bacteroidia bacterium]